jgi:hypothetical protein
MASGWRYGRVSLTFWNDLKVRAWSEDARALALYLMTGPHSTGEGFFHLALETAAGDLSWPMSRLRPALAELIADDFADVDEAPRVVFIVRALKYANTIKGAPAIKGALNVLAKVNGSPRLFGRFLEAADRYQPLLAAEIRALYSIPEGPYQGAPRV